MEAKEQAAMLDAPTESKNDALFEAFYADRQMKVDAHDDLVKALQGLKTIVELSVASKDGRQYAYIETRSGSFVHVVDALKEAEAALAKVGA